MDCNIGIFEGMVGYWSMSDLKTLYNPATPTIARDVIGGHDFHGKFIKRAVIHPSGSEGWVWGDYEDSYVQMNWFPVITSSFADSIASYDVKEPTPAWSGSIFYQTRHYLESSDEALNMTGSFTWAFLATSNNAFGSNLNGPLIIQQEDEYETTPIDYGIYQGARIGTETKRSFRFTVRTGSGQFDTRSIRTPLNTEVVMGIASYNIDTNTIQLDYAARTGSWYGTFFEGQVKEVLDHPVSFGTFNNIKLGMEFHRKVPQPPPSTTEELYEVQFSNGKILDNTFLWNRILTSDEKNFLWNAGQAFLYGSASAYRGYVERDMEYPYIANQLEVSSFTENAGLTGSNYLLTQDGCLFINGTASIDPSLDKEFIIFKDGNMKFRQLREKFL
jgi:hypothetical protein